MTPNHYDTLGVGNDATGEDIKKAFRKRASETHPDKNPSADGKEFALVSMAYECLSDEERRTKYDETGQDIDRPDSIEAAAYGLLEQIVSAGLDGTGTDLLGFVTRQLTDIEMRSKSSQGTAEQAIKRLRKRRDLISRTRDGKNLIHRIIDGKIAAAQVAVDTAVSTLKIVKVTRELVADYEASGEEAPTIARSQSFGGMFELGSTMRATGAIFTTGGT